MSADNSKEQQDNGIPGWIVTILPLICAIAGILAIGATWYFYKDVWNTPSFPWFSRIQPALMVVAGILSLVAAGLFAMRMPAAWEVLKAAVCIIPLILALRLVIAALLLLGKAGSWISGNAGSLMDGSFLQGLTINPLVLVRNVGVIVIVILAIGVLDWLNKADKSGKEPGDKK